MIVKVNDRKFILFWNHDACDPQREFLEYPEAGVTRTTRAVTECVLMDIDTKEPVAQGFALCSPKDQFRKEVGRRISLSRAAKDLSERKNMDYREVSDQIFQQYDNRQ